MNNKRINFFFIIFSITFLSSSLLAQKIQDWMSHISYAADINAIVQAGNKIYALTDGKLFIYDSSDESIEEFIKSDGGNRDITHIKYNNKNKCLFIVRSDYNIELLYEDKSYKNISALKDYTAQNLNKTVNNIYMNEDVAYLSTDFGFCIIDIAKKEIKESGIFQDKNFYSICLFSDKIFAATKQGVFYAETNSNLKDSVNWKKFPVSSLYQDNDYKFKDNSIREIVKFDEKLLFLVPETAIYILDTPQSVKGILKGGKPNSFITSDNGHLIVASNSKCWDFENLSQQISISINGLKYIIPNGNKQSEYWMSSSGNNLSLIKTNNSTFDFLKQWIKPQGPATNYPFSQTYRNNQLLVTGGRFLDNRYGYPANLSIYKDSKWTNLDTYLINTESGMDAKDFVYAISDPLNPSHIFASSWGEGLYEFENNKFKNRYDKTNSSIEELIDNDYRTTRVSGMVYDQNNNLWILNSMVKNKIKVLTKNGEWGQLYFSELDNPDTNPKNILIDRYSNKWVTSVGQDAYIFIFNDNNTINNPADDKHKLIIDNDFVDESGNIYAIHYIYSIAEDNNGNIWIGTDIGPFFIYNSRDIFNKKITLQRIKVVNDATNNTLTDLLSDIMINSIAIDGANQKWLGTQTAGVYLLSSDNKQIEHFTVDDSPLPSNNIVSLSIDSKGVVYFGTERGMMSYNAGVTEGSDDFSNVYVYPNPVRPDYSGLITITGLKSNSNIKITDLKGSLIIEGKSFGGQYSWDGINSKGKRIDTGIYLVFGSSEDGTEGVVTKIMVVND